MAGQDQHCFENKKGCSLLHIGDKNMGYYTRVLSISYLAGGGMVASGPAKRYAGRTTPYVVISCIVAASGGALFG